MHRELLREGGLHNQTAEGEEDKLPSRCFHTPCPQASTSKGQDLIGNRSWSTFSPAICSRWQQQAGWRTAVLLSPLHPSVPGCFPADGRAGGWKDVPSPGWPCQAVCKHLCQPSPHLQHHPRISTSVLQPLCSLMGKDPPASSKSSYQIVFLPRGAHRRAGWSLESSLAGKAPGSGRGDTLGAGFPQQCSWGWMSAPEAFWVSNPHPKQPF